jgi:hypothetical protein
VLDTRAGDTDVGFGLPYLLDAELEENRTYLAETVADPQIEADILGGTAARLLYLA